MGGSVVPHLQVMVLAHMLRAVEKRYEVAQAPKGPVRAAKPKPPRPLLSGPRGCLKGSPSLGVEVISRLGTSLLPISSGSKTWALPANCLAGDWLAEVGRLLMLLCCFPRVFLLSRPCELSLELAAGDAGFEEPMMRSLASAYFLTFSSLSSAAFFFRSSKLASLFLRASSSLSSSSAPFFAMGLRLSKVIGCLGSCFNGTAPCASSHKLRPGFSAEAHSSFCSC